MTATSRTMITGVAAAYGPRLARALAFLWILAAGPVVLVLEMGDAPTPGPHGLQFTAYAIGTYLVIGLVFGLLNPEQWPLSGLLVWPLVLFLSLMFVTMVGPAMLEAANVRQLMATLHTDATIMGLVLSGGVLPPLGTALVGSYLGARVRAWLDERLRSAATLGTASD